MWSEISPVDLQTMYKNKRYLLAKPRLQYLASSTVFTNVEMCFHILAIWVNVLKIKTPPHTIYLQVNIQELSFYFIILPIATHYKLKETVRVAEVITFMWKLILRKLLEFESDFRRHNTVNDQPHLTINHFMFVNRYILQLGGNAGIIKNQCR